MRAGYVEKIVELVNNQNNVRNLSVIAHVGTFSAVD
jgi:hypothetical protein